MHWRRAIHCAARRLSTPTRVAPLSSPSLPLLDELEARGLVQDATSSALRSHVQTTGADGKLVPRTVYSGVDPSAASLHVGNLLPLLSLLHFALRGHTALVLVRCFLASLLTADRRCDGIYWGSIRAVE